LCSWIGSISAAPRSLEFYSTAHAETDRQTDRDRESTVKLGPVGTSAPDGRGTGQSCTRQGVD
jgi:hypothetical protein